MQLLRVGWDCGTVKPSALATSIMINGHSPQPIGPRVFDADVPAAKPASFRPCRQARARKAQDGGDPPQSPVRPGAEPSAVSAANAIKTRRVKRLMPLAIGRRTGFGREPSQGAVGVFGTKPRLQILTGRLTVSDGQR